MKKLTAWLCAALVPLGLGAAMPAAAQGSEVEAQSRALERAAAATVALRVTAVEDARSARTLGRERAGSGVLIGADGLVLTIGYLVLEADVVELVTDDGRELPARVVGYDVATGFGLVQTLMPLARAPVPLGQSARTRGDEPLVVFTGGTEAEASAARLVSRRDFSGYWEYHVDGALFTSPPRRDHSGAGLFNLNGELLGIGSLFVTDAAGPEAGRVPGNMFVPVDLLKPVLAELRARGSSKASARAWLGLNCVDTGGEIRIVRVNDDSPADVAGLQPGDRITAIDGVPVTQLAQLWKQLWAGDRAEREVRLDIVREGQPQRVSVQSVDRAKTLKRPTGV
jgi:serine protease Do